MTGHTISNWERASCFLDGREESHVQVLLVQKTPYVIIKALTTTIEMQQ